MDENFERTKVVSNSTADVTMKFLQRYILNNGELHELRWDKAQTFRAKKIQLFCNTNNIKLLFAPLDDHRAIGVVEKMIVKRGLGVMRIDPANIPYNLASHVAEIIKTLHIISHGETKFSPFEAHLGRKPSTHLSNVATTSSPNNLNWENAEDACLDQKNLTNTPLPAEIKHDLQ